MNGKLRLYNRVKRNNMVENKNCNKIKPGRGVTAIQRKIM